MTAHAAEVDLVGAPPSPPRSNPLPQPGARFSLIGMRPVAGQLRVRYRMQCERCRWARDVNTSIDLRVTGRVLESLMIHLQHHADEAVS